MSEMYRFKLFMIFGLMAMSVQLFSQQRFSLNQAVQFALEHSYEADLGRLDVEALDAQAKGTISIGLPQIKGKFDYNYYFKPRVTVSDFPEAFRQPGVPSPESISFESTSHNSDIGLEVVQLLLDGRMVVANRARKTLNQMSDVKRKQSDLEIRKMITKAYYQVLLTRETADMLAQTRQSVLKTWEDTKTLFEEGFVSQIDVERLELNVANLNTEINNAEKLAVLASNNFKFLMGVDIDEKVILTDALISFKEAAIVASIDSISTGQSVIDKRLEYQLLETQAMLRASNIKNIRTQYYPSIFGYLGYGANNNGQSFRDIARDKQWQQYGLFGITLNVPIFDGLRTHFDIQQKKIEYQKALLEIERFKRAAKLQVSNAQQDLTQAVRELEIQEKNMNLAKKINQKSNLKFKEGVGSSLELSQSETDLVTTKINYLQTLYKLIVAKTELDISKGQF